MGDVSAAVRQAIVRRGPLSFDEYVEEALYGPGGFFAEGRGAGRRGGDFLTSPEVGPLFGAVVARAIDAEWVRLGRPDPFVVVEFGAGRGALARAVIDAHPGCGPALRYLCVERSPVLRAAATAMLDAEPDSDVFAEVLTDDEGERHAVTGRGPIVAVRATMPAGPLVGMVLANELLDNLPVRLFERTGAGGEGRWDEVRVAWADPDDDRLVELLVPPQPEVSAEMAALVPHAEVGARAARAERAQAWLRDTLAGLETGRVVVWDYVTTTPAMAGRPWGDWLRTYRGGDRGSHPLDQPGTQDITCEVPLDQLAQVRIPSVDRSQSEWLADHGIGELVEEGRARWAERAHLGDLVALRARSRLREAEALSDPTGLGGFRVLEWVSG